MKIGRQDIVAALLFMLIAVGGLWLWTGQGPVIWIQNVAIMCGFG